ncbi:MAG TPA: hypothetical protein P5534_16365 [Candidatus Paceibacterota bacterium]|nr:hypothetical protein [Candidatus Paceibacterota bacterium]
MNDSLYCPRRAAFEFVDGWRESNEHTLRANIVHEHTELRGYEVRQGVTLLPALPVFSVRLGLNGRSEVVETESARAISDLKFQLSNFRSLKPAEFTPELRALTQAVVGGLRALFGESQISDLKSEISNPPRPHSHPAAGGVQAHL